MSERLTWDEIVEHCSRLHTTRRRPEGPWPDAELREDSQPLAIEIDTRQGWRPATIIPTRMHEPGFYWRWEDIPAESAIRRSDFDIGVLRDVVDSGSVRVKR